MSDTSLDQSDHLKGGTEVVKKENVSPQVDSVSDEEQILQSLQFLLRFHHIEKSISSIRELADASEGPFDFRDAVSALRNLEFSANVGTLSPKKVLHSHCPAVIKLKDNSIAVLVEIKDDKTYLIFHPENSEKIAHYSLGEFKNIFSKSILLAKSPRQNRVEDQPKKINWFWNSLIQSK